MRWPLRLQILVPYALLMMVVLLTVSFLNALLASRLSQRQIEQQLQGIARTLLDSNFPLSEAVLRQVSGLSGAEFILIDPRGERPPIGSERGSKLAPNLPATEPQTHLELSAPIEIGDQRFFHMSLDMSHRTRSEPRILHVLYPETGLKEAQRQAAYPSLVAGVFGLVTSCVLGLWVASRVSWPIRSVCAHVAQLTQAGCQRLLVPGRNDELRDLVVSVNLLAEQLDDMRLAIRRSERLALLGQLSGGIAHHLRNNVTGARIAVQLHQRHCAGSDPESLEVALRQLSLTEEHLMRLLAAGKPQEVHLAACNLTTLVEEVVRLVSPTCRHRKTTLETVIDDPHPLVLADVGQLRSVIIALVLNAAEAAGADGWVRLGIGSTDQATVTLEVLDSGPGPAPEIVDRLFEPFATNKREGIGLGLAVALQVAKLHNGRVEYRRGSRPTCFALLLPRCTTNEPTAFQIAKPEAVEISENTH